MCVEEAISRDLWPLLGSSICLFPSQEKVPTNETIRPKAAAAAGVLRSPILSPLPCQPSPAIPHQNDSLSHANNRQETGDRRGRRRRSNK